MDGRILLIEDAEDMADLLVRHLHSMGFEADRAADGEQGLQRALAGDYALVICDIMLPKKNGLDVCAELRERKPAQAILMLTSKDQELEKVTGLESGADDYVTKPFNLAELTARIKALLRRASFSNPHAGGATEFNPPLQFGDLKIDVDRRKAWRGENELELTAKEFDLVSYLAQNPGRPYTRDQLLQNIWKEEFAVYTASINAMIAKIRKKLEDNPAEPKFLLTVRGVGYRFVEQSEL